jgi:hypothetical protein
MHNTASTVENGQQKHTEEKKDNFFSETKKLLENYVHDRILLLKLEWTKKAANASAGIANGLMLAVFGLFALIFFSVTLGFVFSELTGSFIWGFAIVTGIYVLLLVLLIANKKWITRKVSGAVISSVFSNKKEKAKSNDADINAVQKN